MNTLHPDKLQLMLACLMEGDGYNATARIVGVSENAIMRNALWIGEACQAYHDQFDRNLPVKSVQCDELFSLVHARDKNLPPHLKLSLAHGEIATWIGMDPDTKFIVSWVVGKHGISECEQLCFDLRARIGTPRPTVYTDGLRHYMSALEAAFGESLDYATINKITAEPGKFADRYVQEPIKGNRIAARIGAPDMEGATTTSVERFNLALRMTSSRYRRHSYFISKKIRYKRAALALRFFYENRCRIHSTIRCTPAMELGIENRVWELKDILAIVPPRPVNRPKTYKKRVTPASSLPSPSLAS